MTVEFSRPVPLSVIGSTKRSQSLVANEAERIALARRFGLLGLDRLEADVSFEADGEDVKVDGRLIADVRQACVATGVAVPAHLDTPLLLRFVPPGSGVEGAEIEIDAQDCDIIDHDGREVDLGEAVAQSLALALDPFPRAPDADQALRAAGVLSEEETGPFAALKGLFADSSAKKG